MEGKKKQIVHEKPTSSASTFPEIPILAASGNTVRPSSFMSPSSLRLPLPRSPTSFNYFEPFSVRGEKEKMDQNPLPPSSQNMSIGNSTKTEVVPVKGRKPDPDMESRKLKRIMSNRLSAHRSRIRKLQYLYDMEKKAESLQNLVHVLSSQVNLQKDKQFLLTIEKRQLQNRITACANRKLMVDAEIEARTAELNRLRELYMAQQNQQMQPQAMGVWEPTEQMMDPSLHHHGTGESMMDPTLNHYLDSDQVDAGDHFMPEISMLDSLHLHEKSPGNNIMVHCEGRLTDVGLGQSGVEQLQNPYLNDQQPEENQIGSFNSSMGELEQIFKSNPPNGVNPINGFI